MNNMEGAVYNVLTIASTPEVLIIEDTGPWDAHRTVTNDAERVVANLISDGLLPEGRRLWYYDSEGSLDELVIKDGRFYEYNPLTASEVAGVIQNEG